MSCVRAEDVLPEELIRAIQRYVSGRSVYIPCKTKKRRDGARTDEAGDT